MKKNGDLRQDKNEGDVTMFINFSNHPSKLWAEDERNAALQYGTIEDLAFPQVPEGAV